MKTSVFIEFQGSSIEEKDIISKIKNDWCEEGHMIKEIKDLKLYIQPESNLCYYVINDDITKSISLI